MFIIRIPLIFLFSPVLPFLKVYPPSIHGLNLLYLWVCVSTLLFAKPLAVQKYASYLHEFRVAVSELAVDGVGFYKYHMANIAAE
jgi:hypothetical protein